MPTLEEFGRRVDVEIEKLKQYFETELKPNATRRTAVFLREASKRLGEMAEELESSKPGGPSENAAG